MRSRRRAVRNQRLVVISVAVVVLFVVLGSVLFGTIKAQAAPIETSYKYYTSIQIEKGDTLWDIAEIYVTDDYTDMQEYIEEICAINHISENHIHAGQYITIPYYSNDYLE